MNSISWIKRTAIVRLDRLCTETTRSTKSYGHGKIGENRRVPVGYHRLWGIPLSIDNSGRIFLLRARACLTFFKRSKLFFLPFFFFFFPRSTSKLPPGAGLKSVEREREGKGAGVDNDEQIKGQT